MHLLSLLTFLLPLTLTSALKFEVHAQPQGLVTPRCIRNFVGADTLVVVTARVSGNKGDGQRVNIEVSLSCRGDVDGRFGIQRGMSMVVLEMLLVRPEWRLLHMAILQLMFVLRISSVRVDLAWIVLIIGYGMGPSRSVELDVDIGSSAFDYAAIQKSEVPFSLTCCMLMRNWNLLKWNYDELRMLFRKWFMIWSTWKYVNKRWGIPMKVQMSEWNILLCCLVCSFLVFADLGVVLLGLSGWQIVYLRTYFKRKGMLEWASLRIQNSSQSSMHNLDPICSSAVFWLNTTTWPPR